MQPFKRQDKNTSHNTAAKILHHWVEVLSTTKTDHDFFQILVEKIIPLIRLIHPDHVKQWEDKIERYKQLQEKVLLEQIVSSKASKEQLQQKEISSTSMELMGLYHDYDLDKVTEPWALWDYLLCAELGWGNPD